MKEFEFTGSVKMTVQFQDEEIEDAKAEASEAHVSWKALLRDRAMQKLVDDTDFDAQDNEGALVRVSVRSAK